LEFEHAAPGNRSPWQHGGQRVRREVQRGAPDVMDHGKRHRWRPFEGSLGPSPEPDARWPTRPTPTEVCLLDPALGDVRILTWLSLEPYQIG
jgi:hypothetical protein